MRQITSRSKLSAATQQRLADKTAAVKVADDPKGEADKSYKSARSAKWFKPVVQALQAMAGPGERCMLCSGSESSQVEHYRPKAVFPELAFDWSNYLWVCGLCNQHKGDRFPPDTEEGGQLINPIDDDVWKYFYIDQFGNLSAQWNAELNDIDPRAAKTAAILKICDPEVRQGLIDSRRARRRDLIKQVKRALRDHAAGTRTIEDLRTELEDWLSQPFQFDVADYFLNGPGREESPFNEFFELIESSN